MPYVSIILSIWLLPMETMWETILSRRFSISISDKVVGYYPHYISHYRAPWVWKNPDEAPKPVWPGVIDGKYFNRKTLEEFYAPWIDAVNRVLAFTVVNVVVGKKHLMKYF